MTQASQTGTPNSGLTTLWVVLGVAKYAIGVPGAYRLISNLMILWKYRVEGCMKVLSTQTDVWRISHEQTTPNHDAMRLKTDQEGLFSSGGVGTGLHLMVATERRTLSQCRCLLDRVPTCSSEQRSTFNTRLLATRSAKECHRKSFIAGAFKLWLHPLPEVSDSLNDTILSHDDTDDLSDMLPYTCDTLLSFSHT